MCMHLLSVSIGDAAPVTTCCGRPQFNFSCRTNRALARPLNSSSHDLPPRPLPLPRPPPPLPPHPSPYTQLRSALEALPLEAGGPALCLLLELEGGKALSRASGGGPGAGGAQAALKAFQRGLEIQARRRRLLRSAVLCFSPHTVVLVSLASQASPFLHPPTSYPLLPTTASADCALRRSRAVFRPAPDAPARSRGGADDGRCR